jgi:1-acyl-sn-glycerol-3-phosphate acyltransferase
MAYLALRTRAPILPVGIVGSPRFNAELKRLRRAAITITVGPPFTLEADGRLDRATLRRLTDDAMRHLAAALPEDMRGIYR